MTGKELLFKVLRHEEAPRVPWVPFTGIHAGYLKGYTASQVLQDSNLLAESIEEAARLYKPDGIPVSFDLQLEAEILGCELHWAEDSPPSVISHPLGDSRQVPSIRLQPGQGRLGVVLDAMERLKSTVGKDTALYGLFCGPFTLASHLRGSTLFMDMMKDPDYTKELIDRCTDAALDMASMYADQGADVVTPVDPLLSQISPKHFSLYCEENYRRIFDYIRSRGTFSAFFVCGNAIRNIEGMCRTAPDAVSVDENLDMAEAQKITKRYNICLGGNIPLSTVMLYGTQQDNMKAVLHLIDTLENKNLIISPGCDMPYAVPVQNGIACAQAVHDPETARKVVKDYRETDATAGIQVNLPDYEHLEKPLLEVFTLDPEACAACTYMLNVAQSAKQELGDVVTMAEYRYNKLEDIARMKKQGIRNLPSLYINGKLKYDSLIPGKEELINELRSLL